MRELRCKNYWRAGGAEKDYVGINCTLAHAPRRQAAEAGSAPQPEPQPEQLFELQLHTEQSIDTQLQRSHVSYEKFRTEGSVELKAQHWEELVTMWSLVEVPDGIECVGTPARHHFQQFDQALRKSRACLTPRLKASIHEKHRLMTELRPRCDALHLRAIEYEVETTLLMRYLESKHCNMLSAGARGAAGAAGAAATPRSVARGKAVRLVRLEQRVTSTLTMSRKVLAWVPEFGV